ncbi:MAG: hypothetical protein QOI82_3167 [Actinomycetota bacterium]|nr:hypothetical protein [Actinomycetota bacterium]
MRKEGVARLTAAAVALLAALSLVAGPAVADETTPPAPAATPIGVGGGWSYFSDPRAVQVTLPRKLLWSGWVTSNGSIAAGVYDPATQQVQTAVLHDRLQNDDHANPSVLALPDGRVTYFWSAHNGLFMYYRTTAIAGDVHSFGPLRTLPVRPSGDRLFTYSNPILLPAEGNRLYLFWRSQFTHQAFATSDDLGVHWSPARVLLEEPGQRPYVKYAANNDTIGIAFTRSHPDESRTGIYYMSYWHDAFFRADGTAIGGIDDLPFAPAQTELVVDPDVIGGSAWVMDVALEPNGNPVIVYVATGATHRYHYVRWDGTAWHDTLMTDAGPPITTGGREPSYSGGISLDHSDPSTAYLSRRVGDHNVVERWHTDDGGTTFTSAAVAQDLTVDNVRPVVPLGLTPEDTDRAIWMAGTYHYFTEFATSIVGPPVVPPTPEVTTIRVGKMPARTPERSTVRMTARLFNTGSGHPTVNAEVTLFSRRAGGLVWSRVDSARTDSTGLVSFRSPTILNNTELMIDWPGDERWTAAQTAPVRIVAVAPYGL